MSLFDSTSGRFSFWPWVMILFLAFAQNALALIFPDHPPALVYLGVVFYGLVKGPVFGLALGLFAGIYFEIFCIGTLGAPALFLGLVGYASGHAATKIFRDSFLIECALPIILFYFYSLLNQVFFLCENGLGVGLSVLWQSFQWMDLLFLGIEAPFIFNFLRRWTTNRNAAAVVSWL